MNDAWERKSLFEAIELQRGFDLPASDRHAGDVPVVASTSVVGSHNASKVAGPGVVVGRSGSIGGAQWINKDFWPLNTTLWVKDFRGNDPLFVYHLLKSIDFSAFNVGSGVPTLNRNHLSAVQVELPPYAEQRRIAGVLGALDDLIEVNRGLVVDLDAALSASWQQAAASSSAFTCFGEVARATKGLSYKGAFLAEEGLPMINMGSFGIDGTHRLAGLKWYVESEVKAKNRLVKGDLVIVNTDLTQSRDILARPIIVPFEHATSTHHTFQVRVPGGEAQRFWLYCALRQESVRQRLISYATGTTVAALPLDALTSQDIPWAEDSVIDQWWNSTEPLYTSQLALLDEIQQLITTRDELLPLLMSGRVRVAEAVAA